jgi:hypothetical protein
MTPPDWLIPILQQFPIVALVMTAVWLMLRWADDRHRRDVERLTTQLDRAERRADAADVKRDQAVDRAEAARQAEVGRVVEHFTAEVRRLQARIRELERRSNPPEES